MQYSATALAPVAFQLVPQLILGKLDVHLGRAGVEVAERFLHDMQRGALLDHFGAACVAQSVNGIHGLAVSVEQRSRSCQEGV